MPTNVSVRPCRGRAELLRVVDGVLPVRQRVGDAVVQQLRDLADHLGPEIAADDVAAERQRQAAGPLVHHFAQVHDLPQAVVGVGELPLVDQQSRRRPCRPSRTARSDRTGTTTYSKSGS
jgi:hypothetical protein